jgi:hypothetical protein
MARAQRRPKAPSAGRVEDSIVVLPGVLTAVQPRPTLTGQERVERNAVNCAELRANAQNILSIIHDVRPDNTSSAYEPKQKEFQAFCRAKHYQDSDTVTEDKLLLFLVEEVANRPLRAKSFKVAAEAPWEETRLAWCSVRAYVTAITDLYRTQKALGMNTHPSPREDNVREYLKSLQRRDSQRDRANYADKGRDTFLDGYTEQEFERVCHELCVRRTTAPTCHVTTPGHGELTHTCTHACTHTCTHTCI